MFHRFRILPLVFFLLGWFSCRELPDHSLLIGTWKIISDSSPEDSSGYFRKQWLTVEFLNDSMVDLKTRQFEIIDGGFWDHRFRFLGTSVPYSLLADSLTIQDSYNPVWESPFQIERLDPDTLILCNSHGRRLTFQKHSYLLDSAPALDQIVLTTRGCDGPCPQVRTLIDSTGHVFIYGGAFSNLNGFYEGAIPISLFQAIKEQFQRADIPNLMRRYEAEHTDDETVTTTLVHRDSIIHSMDDYGESGPDELVWAYTSLRYLYQQIPLTPLDSTIIPAYLDQWHFWFEKDGKKLFLSDAESFLLQLCLYKGKRVTERVEKGFGLKYVPLVFQVPSEGVLSRRVYEKGELISVATDGRIYSFYLFGEATINIDIGFDFLARNADRFSFPDKYKPNPIKDPSP